MQAAQVLLLLRQAVPWQRVLMPRQSAPLLKHPRQLIIIPMQTALTPKEIVLFPRQVVPRHIALIPRQSACLKLPRQTALIPRQSALLPKPAACPQVVSSFQAGSQVIIGSSQAGRLQVVLASWHSALTSGELVLGPGQVALHIRQVMPLPRQAVLVPGN